ncbi:MAG: hypothetical protein AAFO07_25620, partial [Bacteroidota bacterium]
MKLIINLFAYFFIVQFVSAQSVLDSAYIAGKTKYFKVENGKITGEGIVFLKKIARENQFVAYGERHNSARTSE